DDRNESSNDSWVLVTVHGLESLLGSTLSGWKKGARNFPNVVTEGSNDSWDG
ncbi:hypothetical protein HAX54_013955, partial [Datura stramonium]|nr:hypothetical protein [Datura stramonium]